MIKTNNHCITMGSLSRAKRQAYMMRINAVLKSYNSSLSPERWSGMIFYAIRDSQGQVLFHSEDISYERMAHDGGQHEHCA